MENIMEILQTTKNRTTILLPGIYLEKMGTQMEEMHALIAALYTIAKTGKQPRCPSANEWIKKIWYKYNRILLSHKKEWNSAVCSNVDEYYA